MLRVLNKTPFEAALMPDLDKDGTDYAVIVAKGTFPIRSDSDRGAVQVEPFPVAWPDKHFGEPDKTSIKYAGDGALRKPGTDVYLVASAHAQRAGVRMVDVSVEIGAALKKSLRVIGDRKWYKSLGSWRASEPAPFESIPVVYERAFGGRAPAADGSPGEEFDNRNPVGVGFAGKSATAGLEGKPLPNVEDARAPITSTKDRPEPVGFGALGRGWDQRARWAGTMDEAWKTQRCPLLPVDFDDRYHQAAAADLVSPRHLQGGEPVRLTNLSRLGTQVFSLPRHAITVTARIRGVDSHHPAVLDTVLIEPDLKRMVLSWRATVPCPRDFLHIEFVRIEEGA